MGTLLASEIKAIETIIAAPGNPAEGSRQEALIRLARLQQLTGDLETAAKTWQAAAAEQGSQTQSALVSGAFCMAAMGDWKKTAELITPVLRENTQSPILLRAHYLDACNKAWTGNDASGLGNLAENPEYTELRSAIYYTLWKLADLKPGAINGGEAASWKVRLLEEFPHSPESRIASAETSSPAQTGAATAIKAKPSPHWLLLPGIEGVSETPRAAAQEMPTPAAPVPAATVPATPAPATQVPAATVPTTPAPAAQVPAAPTPTAPQPPAQPTRVLQTGLFGVEANAINQMNQLRKAGFPADIMLRTVNGRELWAVTVPAGQNMNHTIQELKKAGFDSFPL